MVMRRSARTLDMLSPHEHEIVVAGRVSRKIANEQRTDGLYDIFTTGYTLADEAITQKIKQVPALLDVKVIDHLIVGETIFFFSKAGLI